MECSMQQVALGNLRHPYIGGPRAVAEASETASNRTAQGVVTCMSSRDSQEAGYGGEAEGDLSLSASHMTSGSERIAAIDQVLEGLADVGCGAGGRARYGVAEKICVRAGKRGVASAVNSRPAKLPRCGSQVPS
jgi:hypothetical protein